MTRVRHTLRAVRQEVEFQLRESSFDVVVAEQVQALGNVWGLKRGSRPLLWRAQNVESDLWQATAREVGWARWLLADEARRLADWEGEAVAGCDGTLALTRQDADRLGRLAHGQGAVHHLPAPFDEDLPAAEQVLPGRPALVLFGSAGWRPNQSGEERFLRKIWPVIRRRVPEAVLHLFGGEGAGLDGVEVHPRPEDSREAFAPGSVLVVPLWVASGVRMKILEAWSRGSAVLATPVAARGLEATAGEELLLAESAEEFAEACARLAEPSTQQRLVTRGREHLELHHGLPSFARRFEEIVEGL